MDTRKLLLKSVNAHITCYICKGYLVDATTVIDCLHTFCKSCLLKHFEENDNCCPKCECLIHQSHPSHYVSFDRTMQDIVYKLAPNLLQNETKREKEYYKKRGLPYPKANIGPNNEKDGLQSNNKYRPEAVKTSNGNGGAPPSAKEESGDYHKSDEQVNILLESLTGSNLKAMKRKFIRCSAHTTVTHIKKFVAKKLFDNFDKYTDIDILCNDELLGKDHTLKFVTVTRWRHKEPPMRLCYRPRIDY